MGFGLAVEQRLGGDEHRRACRSRTAAPRARRRPAAAGASPRQSASPSTVVISCPSTSTPSTRHELTRRPFRSTRRRRSCRRCSPPWCRSGRGCRAGTRAGSARVRRGTRPGWPLTVARDAEPSEPVSLASIYLLPLCSANGVPERALGSTPTRWRRCERGAPHRRPWSGRLLRESRPPRRWTSSETVLPASEAPASRSHDRRRRDDAQRDAGGLGWSARRSESRTEAPTPTTAMSISAARREAQIAGAEARPAAAAPGSRPAARRAGERSARAGEERLDRHVAGARPGRRSGRSRRAPSAAGPSWRTRRRCRGCRRRWPGPGCAMPPIEVTASTSAG